MTAVYAYLANGIRAMTAPLDVQAVLEFAGADINAAPGSVPHSLALVAQQHAALREKLRSCEEALQAVEADRDALAGERDALLPNAERYLWLRYRTGGLRAQWGTEFHFPGIKTLPAGLPDWPAACNVGEYLDAAIDRARS